MGKLITFWSPVKGQSKVTSSLCAVVAAFGMLYPQMKVAVTSVCGNASDLEDRLDEKIGWVKKQELYDRSGMNALLAGCKQSSLTKEAIRRCAMPLLMRSVSLYPGLGKEMKLIHGRNMEELEFYTITECLVEEYDITFVDLESSEEEKAGRYMEAATLVVIVLPQNPMVWRRYKEMSRKLPRKKVFLVLGGYLPHSRYGLAALRRSFFGEEHKVIGAIPANPGFMDALAEGRTMEYFLRNERVKKREGNYEFMAETKKVTERMRKYLHLHTAVGQDLPDAE